MKLLMRTNEHVAGQRGPLFRWPVLEAWKTIEIFNVKGDFFFFFSFPSLGAGAPPGMNAHEYTAREHINTAGKQSPQPIRAARTATRAGSCVSEQEKHQRVTAAIFLYL